MAHIYCSSCGGKIESGSIKPKFCSSCGNSLTAGFTPPKKQKEEIEAEQSIEVSEIPNLKIGVDIIVGNIEGPKKLQDIIKERPLGINRRTIVASQKSVVEEMRELSKDAPPPSEVKPISE